MIKKLVLVFMLVSMVPVMIFAGTTGKIAGVVTDKSTGEPLPGVNLVVEGTMLGASTDLDGYFVILKVPVGFYSIRGSYIGYRELVVQEVKISADLTSEVNFEMTPTALELGETIVVTAERELIRKDETNKIEIRTAEEIRVLPMRDLNDLSSLTAGAIQDEDNIYMRGGRSNETAFVLDGVVQNELFFGLNRTNINANSIEELQIQTGGFNAEYGSIMSGLVIITTQAGRPEYRFTAEAISDAFLPRDNNDFGAYSYGYEDYNFTLSGPVVPGYNKLTFFGSFQRLIMADRDPRLNWADDRTYTFVDPYNFPVFEGDSLVGFRNDTLSKTFDENIKPGNWERQSNFSGKLRFQLSNNFEILLSGIYSVEKNQNTNLGGTEGSVTAGINRARSAHMLINSEHAPRTEYETQSYNMTFTHTLNPTTFYNLRLGYYDTFRERGDGVFFDDMFAYGDPAKNPFIAADPETGEYQTGVTLNNTIARSWHGRGYLYPYYSKQVQQMYSANLDFTRQQGKNHLIKFGGEFRYSTLRWYNMGPYPGIIALAKGLADLQDAVAQYGEEYAWYLMYRNGCRLDYFGYDFRGNEVEEGDWFRKDTEDPSSIVSGRPEAPKHPIIASAYLQDKIEFNDLILNLGLRFDYLNANDWQFKDIYSPYHYGDQDIFDEADVEDSKVHTFLSPRLGFAYPVTENTVFHAQYGKFYQLPRLIDLYTSKNYVDIMLVDAPYYDNVGFPNLEPERTTAYEIGFKQKMGMYAALNITAFYKEIAGLVREENFATDIQNVGFMQNNDFGTVKGFEIGFTLRRYHNISASVNYSLSFAVGTGSNSNTLRNVTWLQTNYPKSTNPLDFDQRHTGNVNLDWRLGENKGPVFGNIYPFENFGVNMLFYYNSGRPYTAVRVLAEPFWGGGTGERPQSAINANYSPWNYMMDMKIDKTFNLPLANSRVNVYLWVLNVLNTENAVNVYPYTGDVDNNGWLDSPDGQAWVVSATPEEVELYKKRQKNPFMYGPPRQIRLGLRFEL